MKPPTARAPAASAPRPSQRARPPGVGQWLTSTHGVPRACASAAARCGRPFAGPTITYAAASGGASAKSSSATTVRPVSIRAISLAAGAQCESSATSLSGTSAASACAAATAKALTRSRRQPRRRVELRCPNVDEQPVVAVGQRLGERRAHLVQPTLRIVGQAVELDAQFGGKPVV